MLIRIEIRCILFDIIGEALGSDGKDKIFASRRMFSKFHVSLILVHDPAQTLTNVCPHTRFAGQKNNLYKWGILSKP